jgi:hypothetical protein
MRDRRRTAARRERETLFRLAERRACGVILKC